MKRHNDLNQPAQDIVNAEIERSRVETNRGTPHTPPFNAEEYQRQLRREQDDKMNRGSKHERGWSK